MSAADRIREALDAVQRTQAALNLALAELTRAGVDIRPEPLRPPVRSLHVCVDPGHGGQDPGAVAADGTKEKDVVLRYSEALQRELTRRGHRATMTRTGDTYPGLAERARKADEVGADALVSMHANAADSKLANGAWVIYDDATAPGPKGGRALAEAIFQGMAKVPGVADTDAAVEVFPDRSPQVGNRNLAVLSTQRAVAVLVELGFLTNEEDLRQLQVVGTVEAVCRGIADGLEAWAAAG